MSIGRFKHEVLVGQPRGELDLQPEVHGQVAAADRRWGCDGLCSLKPPVSVGEEVRAADRQGRGR